MRYKYNHPWYLYETPYNSIICLCICLFTDRKEPE